MLRIDRPVQVDGAIAFADDEKPARYYVVATEPRLTLCQDGTAALDLIKYRYSMGDQGGIIELRVDLSPHPSAVQALKAATGHAEFVAPQWTDGQATLSLPTIGGVQAHPVPMSLSGFGEGQFSCAVDAASATVLETALKQGGMPLQVNMVPHVLGRLSSGRMRIFLHAGAAAEAWPQIAALPEAARHAALAAAGAAGVEILEAPHGGSEVTEQLTRWGWTFLDSLFPPNSQGVPTFTDKEFVLEGRTVLACPLTTTGSVTGFDPARDHNFVTEVDLSGAVMPILDITARTNALFAQDGIAAVLVDISYGGTTQTLTFTEGEQELHARFRWNSAERDSYSYRAAIQFTASANRLVLPAKTSSAHQLMIGLDDMGRLTVDVSALAVDWTDLAEIVVTITSGGDQIPVTTEPVRLTPEVRGARYQRHAPGSFADGWSYAIDYVFAHGTRIHRDMTPGFGHQIQIDDPYPHTLQIEAVAYGGFDGIRSHTVELRYRDRLRTVVLDPSQPRAVVRFGTDSPAESTYRWWCLTTFTDGHSETTPEITSDDRMLAIGSTRRATFDVRIAADLLDPTVVKLVRLTLAHHGSDGNDVTASRAITPGAAETVVSIPVNNGEDPTYTVTTTVFRVDGTRTEAGPTTSTAGAIVLPAQGI